MKKYLILLFLSFFFVAKANATTLIISQDNRSGQMGMSGWSAQSFTYSQAFMLQYLELGIYNVSSANCRITLCISTTKASCSSPVTNVITNYFASSTNSLVWDRVNLTGNLSANTTYWINFQETSDACGVSWYNSPSQYSGGYYYHTSTDYPNGDLRFRVYKNDIVCGDSQIGGSETCDDGNIVNGDGCSSSCALESCVCGNSVVQNYTNQYGTCLETCDDGNQISGDNCNKYCTSETGLIGGIASASSTYMTYMAQATSGMSDGFSKLLQFYLGIFLLFVIISMVFTIVIRVMWSMKKRSKPFVFNTEKTVHQNNNIKNYYSDDTPISTRERGLFGEIKRLRQDKYKDLKKYG